MSISRLLRMLRLLRLSLLLSRPLHLLSLRGLRDTLFGRVREKLIQLRVEVVYRSKMRRRGHEHWILGSL